MAVNIPYINPFRFQKMSVEIDNDTLFPSFDNMRLNTKYQKGIYPLDSKYYPDHLINKEFSVIVHTNLPEYAFSKYVIKPDGSTSGATIANITPSSWVGDDVFLITYTPTIEGVYYIVLNGEYISDPINVRSSDSDMVKVQYYDDNNSNEGLFYDYDLSIWVWQPIRYFTGQVITGEPQNEYSIYKDDPGINKKTRSEPIDTIQLNLTDISQLELKIINRMFSCSNILVNGVDCQNTEPPEYEPIPKSEMCNVSILMTITKDDKDYYKFS